MSKANIISRLWFQSCFFGQLSGCPHSRRFTVFSFLCVCVWQTGHIFIFINYCLSELQVSCRALHMLLSSCVLTSTQIMCLKATCVESERAEELRESLPRCFGHYARRCTQLKCSATKPPFPFQWLDLSFKKVMEKMTDSAGSFRGLFFK